ncbi:uncharacterized protein LOC141912256 [Tubulanus polymorphus]|uniref:uncharacterized protein LOC141912256 n=1 Tax=Tubulanus polymorphus TaxID=672921 RepID=UPI003DA2D378
MTDNEDSNTSKSKSLKATRTSLAGWLTRAIDAADSVRISAAVEPAKQCITGCLQNLQTAHDKFMSVLENEEEIETAGRWMECYFDKAMVALERLDNFAKRDSSLDPNAPVFQASSTSSMSHPVAEDLSENVVTNAVNNSSLRTIDAWIDDLVEGVETIVNVESSTSLEEAVIKMEIDRDLPKVGLPMFDGSPLVWPRFIEQFYVQVHNRPGIKDSRRQDLLQSHVKGEARELIQGLGFSGCNYARSLKELKFVFGHRVHVARAYIGSITNGPPTNSYDSISLRSFYISVRDCLITLKQMNYLSEIGSSDLLQKVVKRIPIDKRSKWNEFVRRISRQRDPTLFDLESWLKDCVDADFGPFSLQQNRLKLKRNNFSSNALGSRKINVNNSTKQMSSSCVSGGKIFECVICSGSHSVSNCGDFIDKSVDERFALVKRLRLCINCLSPGHFIATCKSLSCCKEPGCGKRHHTLLHVKRKIKINDIEQKNQTQNLDTCNSESQASSSQGVAPSAIERNIVLGLDSNCSDVYFQVLPIVVQGANGRRISTYGLLDSGSDVTLIREDLAIDLGLSGKKQVLTINTLHSSDAQLSRRVSFTVRSNDPLSEIIHVSQAWTTSGNISCPLQKYNEFSPHKLKHLEGLRFPDTFPRQVKVLLGANVPRAHIQLEVREGTSNQPLAIRTRLGWCLFGNMSNDLCDVHVHSIVSECSLVDENSLSRQIENFWSTESFGVTYPDKIGSVEDQRALKILEETTQLVGDHYQVGMLWRDENSVLPNNFPLAKRRFDLLTNRLCKDSVIKNGYCDTLNGYISAGYARKLTPEEEIISTPRTWYLPHHCVLNPNKPGKFRVVFDAASQFRGSSLKNLLMTGPDLLNSLFGVLQRFRLFETALVADIQAMFHQVRTSESESESLRFLWRPDGSYGSPEVFKMLVHIFGARDSPCCANYALKRSARDNIDCFSSIAVNSVLRNFYVDDFLKSVPGDSKALQLAYEVKDILAKGGFHLTKWMSSSKWVLSQIHPEELANPSLDLDLGDLSVERTLGVKWNAQNDSFVFKPVIKDVKLTKRGIISAVSSIFDPLGFLSPFILRAKCLIQDIWRSGFEWDEDISGDLLVTWDEWQNELKLLHELKIPRHHELFSPSVSNVRLHLFSDASERAFGSVAYLRYLIDSSFQTTFLASKTHLAPTKHPCARCSYVGPEFLRVPEKQWPSQPDLGIISDIDENLKKTKLVNKVLAFPQAEPVIDLTGLVQPEDYSRWYPLLRRTAWILRAIRNFASHVPRLGYTAVKAKTLTVEDFDFAETCLVSQAQRDSFPEEFSFLKKGKLKDHSSLRCLDPVFDGSCIRVGGRIHNAPNVSVEARHQLLLPFSHHITELLVRKEHLIHFHAGPEHLISLVRQKYWPIKARSVAKRAISRCFGCRRRLAKPRAPFMSDLPAHRITSHCRPFHFSGVDYFGPLFIKRGRSTIKVWVCLFTCLVTRAVHLEVADSMETDTFLLILRNFIGRRGQPSHIYSDNGSNFVGAERELRECLTQLNQSRISNFCHEKGIKWTFNSPCAPHFGGVWERLVRTVKAAIKSVLKGQSFPENVLRTTLIEVEASVNSRPLTYNSVDPADFTPITPNHFLHGGASSVVALGVFHEREINSRKRWRQSQVLADHFWRHWLKEYLPPLTMRSKWLENTENVKLGDLVLIKDKDIPRGQWPLGRIIEVYPSPNDGRIRSVKVKTSSSEYVRPVVKLCVLEESIV